MKRLVLILFLLCLGIEIGNAEALDPGLLKKACPAPHRLTQHMHNVRSDLRLLLGGEGQKKIGDVTLKTERIDIPNQHQVHVVFHSEPNINKDGFLVCSYDEIYHHKAVPLMTIYMRATKELGDVKKPQQGLNQPQQ